ncbi:Cell division protein ZapE [Candidatus Trichorickettsia mobilis]|uniref:Cell division protein ZapE n=1 Tax=Candidatus Trichorickettsia mobilis TaxID=1346319 RepID=A0ABZ0UQN3_9RICK|nr:cell division protein ZapE [Candidatus Trichorickettsia mobilis]WPY00348.1 Cell division protein ZapE [Candidatus Trichorickettsia mobilis]
MSIQDFLPPDFDLDTVQLTLIDKIEAITNSLTQQSTWIPQFFKPKKYTKSGIYLYGGVGRGKTMLMQAFYNNLKLTKTMLHYQDFMLSIHKNLHNLQGTTTSKIIADLAANYAREWQILCLDEFEIKDITDAMIIGKLFVELNKRNVFIFITSNTKPEELYKDGLQRDSFLPFIDYLQYQFEILHLDNHHDYRLDKFITAGDRVLYPLTQDTQDKIQHIITALTHNNSLTSITLEVFGRPITFQHAYQNILVTNFQELCMQAYGYADYVNICQRFKVVVLKNVIPISANNNDLITRFINFIDNAYFYKVLLFITLQDTPGKIYPEGRRAEDFKRTISRLYEMNSDSYPP